MLRDFGIPGFRRGRGGYITGGSGEPMSEYNSNDLLRCTDAINKERQKAIRGVAFCRDKSAEIAARARPFQVLSAERVLIYPPISPQP